LLQEHQFVSKGENVVRLDAIPRWKIGEEDPHEGGGVLHLLLPFDGNHKEMESGSLELFADIFKKKTEYGENYFEGDICTMIDTLIASRTKKALSSHLDL